MQLPKVSKQYANISDQDTSTQLVRIDISLDCVFCDRSTTESPPGQVNGEAVLTLKKQRTKDDVKSEIKTTGETAFKDVLYEIVNLNTNPGFIKSDTAVEVEEN